MLTRSESHPILAREGWGHIALSLLASVVVSAWVGWIWAVPFWLFTVFVVQFFRDPKRVSPQTPGSVLAPADGKVVFIGPAADPCLDRQATKISVFMNVFSVHSNRSPVKGTIKQITYVHGRFVNAELDKSSEENERNTIWVEDADSGKDVVFVQVAGLIARRILCYVKEGEYVERGQRYGFIRFGSRVDLYLPVDCSVDVKLGDKVTAGVDVVANLG